MFHTSCDELVRKVGIYFDNKYFVLASPEKPNKKDLHHKICTEKIFISFSDTSTHLRCFHISSVPHALVLREAIFNFISIFHSWDDK